MVCSRLCHGLLLLLALTAVCWTGTHGATAQEPAGAAEPRLSVTLLPFFSTASANSDAAGVTDEDAYGKVTAAPGSPGPAALIQDWLRKHSDVAPVLADRDPAELAPVQIEGVILSLEHRKNPATPTGWEAFAEIGIRVSDTGSKTELYSDFCTGTAPARGPLKAGIRSRLLANGLGAYLDYPLGKAFSLAVERALYGASPANRPDADEEPGEESHPGILRVLAKLMWEAHVIGPEQGAYRITAGAANGLQAGDLLTPFAESKPGEEGALRERKRIPGVLRVRTLELHQALVEEVPGEGIPGGTQVSGVYFGRNAKAGFTEAIIVGNDLPAGFVLALRNKLNYLESVSQGRWPKDSILADAHPIGKGSGGRVKVEVVVQDGRRRIPVTLGSWIGTVSDADAASNAEECINSVWPKVLAKGGAPMAPAAPKTRVVRAPAPVPTPRIPPTAPAAPPRPRPVVRPLILANTHPPVRPDPAPVPMPTRAAAPAGAVKKLVVNRRQGFQLGLNFDAVPPAPADRIFHDTRPVAFLLAGSTPCYGALFNFDSNRELTQVWPNPARTGGAPEAGEIPMRPGIRIPARIGGTLGQELMIAVAWKNPDTARDMVRAMRKPGSLNELMRVVRTLSAKRTEAAPAEPAGFNFESLFVRQQPAAKQLAGAEANEYATALLDFRSER